LEQEGDQKKFLVGAIYLYLDAPPRRVVPLFALFLFLCRILFAFSNSRFRVMDRLLPARLMKYWIIRMPDPTPPGLTLFLAIVLAIVWASLLNKSLGG
jgi:hypothetical protein